MKFKRVTVVAAGIVAAGLALSPISAIAYAEDNAPDRDGYMECIDQQPEGPDGREEDTTIQVCCLTHNGTVEEDYGDPTGNTHWCNIPAEIEDVEQSTPTPPKPPVRAGTDVIAPLEPSVLEPSQPTRPPVSAWRVAALG